MSDINNEEEIDNDQIAATPYDSIVFENPENIKMLDKKNNLLKRKSAYITLHDVASMIKLIEVTMERGGIEEDEKEDVIALKQRFIRFLNIAVPEEYDLMADREKVKAYVEKERAEIEATRLPDGSLPAAPGRLDKTGGAPFPL